MAAATLAEKLDKIKSPGLQSQQKTVVVLNAVESTLKGQDTEASPTAYFAALLSVLDKSIENGSVNTETTVSVVYLLDVVAPFAPEALLRAKFTQILTILAPVLLEQMAEASLLRPSIGCLETLLLAQDKPAWELSVVQIGPRRAVAGLLNLAADHRPKVRKRAQEALKKILKNPPPSPSLDHPAADMCAQTALANLAELANKALNGRKSKNGSDPSHDPAISHTLQLIKAIAAASGGWPSKKLEDLCDLLLGIAKTGNSYMTVTVFEIFEQIFEGMADEVASAKLPRLMELISELRPAQNDTQLVPPWLAILSRGYEVSAQIDPDETFQNLPTIFELVLGFMESPAKNIRVSASECLVSFMATCIPRQVILEPSIYDEKTLEKLAKLAESLLTVKYQAAALETFNLLAAMFDALRWRAYPVLLNVAKTVGEIRGNDSFQNKSDADEVIGKAIRAMGPEAVLSVLPLNLAKPGKGQPGRVWLLPVLRDYTANTSLTHFRSEMVPLSESMFQRILENGEAEKTLEVKIFETVVQQIWSTLPGYCDLPLDLVESFDQSFAELLANLLYQQLELRQDICRALRVLVESNQAIAAIEDEAEDMVLQSRVSRETARKNLDHLGAFANNMLAVLFNVYSSAPLESRGPILQTINRWLSITPAAALVETFGRLSALLAEELKKPPTADDKAKKDKSGSSLPPTSNTLMDLAIAMAIYLPRESFASLFEIASVVIFREEEPQLQKKAYKLIPRLVETETGKTALRERYAELQALLHSSVEKVSAPARRDRLAAIMTLLEFIPDDGLHVIPTVLSEVVICCKESNERCRQAAFDLLVAMGERMSSTEGAFISNSKVPHMPKDAPAVAVNIEEYFTMVGAGLAGTTPHMISATITALSRLLFEFRRMMSPQTLSELVQTMDLFLTSKNREIVKSVLGFIKVGIVSLPTDLMLPRLPTLIPNLISWSHEHTGHFKLKVKHMLERMIRKYGYDLVYNNCPESDRKFVISIRKTKEYNKRKQDRTNNAEEDNQDEPAGKIARRFESEYDQALYSSESDESGGEDAQKPAKKQKGGRQGGAVYIVEDEDEPLDLLDRRALANISSTRPVKPKQRAKSKAKVNEDGKLVLGKDSDDEGGAMEVDGPNPEESGVGAYVAALKGRDAARRGRGGKLKFSNKRGKDQDEEMDGEDAAEVKSQLNKASPRGGRFRGQARPGRGGRGKSGRGGIAAGRRGLGVDKRHGPSMGGGINKAQRGRR